MSKKGGLDQYDPEHSEVQPCNTTGLKRVHRAEIMDLQHM